MNKILFVAILSTTLLSACNTIAGVGADITKTAQWTQNRISGPDSSQGVK